MRSISPTNIIKNQRLGSINVPNFHAVGGAYLFSRPRVLGVTKKFSEINNTKHVQDELNLQHCWWSSQRSATPRGVC
jgi:hypothetical protein